MIPTVTRNCPRFVAYFLDVTSNQGQVGDAMVLRLSSHFLDEPACVEPCFYSINYSLNLLRKWLPTKIVTSTGDGGYTI